MKMRIEAPRQMGVCVRRERTRQGLSRAQLAKRSGVSERSLASLELGDATGMRLDKLLAVLAALDLSLSVCGKDRASEAGAGVSVSASVPAASVRMTSVRGASGMLTAADHRALLRRIIDEQLGARGEGSRDDG